MRKAIFLEYKFGDYNSQNLTSSGANEVIAWMENLNPSRHDKLREWGIKIGLSFAATEHGTCPLDPQTHSRISGLVSQAIAYAPDFICFDHLRFDGYWEGMDDSGRIPDTHPPCNFCHHANRNETISQLTKWLKESVPNIALGYFAVPFPADKTPLLGQDHKLLSPYFDFVCPMLYHRMINKPASYISEFTQYLSGLTHKPILPIVQVKDMPDNLPDGVTENVLQQEYTQAVKSPSAGIAWFSWDAALEKHKSQIITQIWKWVSRKTML